MAIVLAIQRWRPYLLGQKFIVRTDQRALKYLLGQRVIQPRYQRWLVKLLGYQFEVQYHSGPDNKVADALSRVTPTVHLARLEVPPVIDVEVVLQEVLHDPKLSAIILKLQHQEDTIAKFNLQYYKGRLFLSRLSFLLPAILHTYHNSVFGGHSVFTHLLNVLRENYIGKE